ncbi:hypothetical protein P691DRAFT_643579, partial [Macrolepiota fuliginosa MF-IS2]
DPLEEPPPYTPRADPLQGETTVEVGPSRPFQQAPAHQSQPQPQSRPAQSTFLSPHPTGSSRRGGGSLWQQLSDQFDQFATQLERHATGMNSRPYGSSLSPQRTGAPWSSYPGQSASGLSSYPRATSAPAPPLPPRRPSTSPVTAPESSEFAREFYTAGTGDELSPETEAHQSVSHQLSQNHAPPPQHPPEERGPTTTPVPGRPLLRSGQLLVYPRGHICEKCHNTGYKHYDPLRPCKKCWSKYSKPFSGPLAYSYSSSPSTSNTQNINLQKPLPLHIGGPPRRQGPPLPPRPASIGGYHHTIPQDSYYTRGPAVTATPGMGAPPPGATIYRPGDPRIGGDLCWRCNGKGTMNIFIDIINCPICGGCGRTF